MRLDLFGDTIESIRRFDPATQRSADKVAALTLRPVSELSLDEASVSRFRSEWRDLFGPDAASDPAGLAERSLLRRLGDPGDLARALRFAADSPYLTGASVAFDQPWSVVPDTLGNIWVSSHGTASTYGNRLVAFNPTTHAFTSYPSGGLVSGCDPYSIAIDAHDDIFFTCVNGSYYELPNNTAGAPSSIAVAIILDMSRRHSVTRSRARRRARSSARTSSAQASNCSARTTRGPRSKPNAVSI